MAAVDEFTEFYAAEFAPTAHALRPIVGGLAEEVAQDAFLVVLARWPTVAALEEPGAWLRLVARRLAWRVRNREHSRRAREASTLPSSPLPAPHAVPDVDLWRALARLPYRYRLAVMLRDVAGYSLDEVAEAIDATPGATKTLLSRARNRLGELVSGHRGLWVSRHRWTADDVAARIRQRAEVDAAAVDLVEVASRGVRWTIAFGHGTYRIATDDGQSLDHGLYRIRRHSVELFRPAEPGAVVLASDVSGRAARFAQVSNDTPPTRGIPDGVYLDILLSADVFVRATPAHVGV